MWDAFYDWAQSIIDVETGLGSFNIKTDIYIHLIDTDGTIVNQTWFLDNTILYGENVSYQFNSSGYYPVKLEIMDNMGGVDVIAKMIPVDFQI